MKYKIVNPKHPMTNKVFNGTPTIINGEDRIWDNETVGNSYPAIDCIIYQFLPNGIYFYDIACKDNKSHIFNSFGEVIFEHDTVAKCFEVFKSNNGKQIGEWKYEISNEIEFNWFDEYLKRKIK